MKNKMACRASVLLLLALCLGLAGCKSGPSSSAPDEAATAERKAAHLEGLMARRALAAQALDDVLSALPDRVRLTEAAYDQGRVRLKGRAPSNDLLADYISRLGDAGSLKNVSLGGSTARIVGGRSWAEFSLQADVRDPALPSSPPGASPAARLAELEPSLASRPDSAGTLRSIQRLILEAGLQMAKFAPGAESPGEFTTAMPLTVEVTGDASSVGRFLGSLAALPELWVVDRFSLRAVSPDDRRSPVRASIAATAYLAR
jgi:hypothetical protein